MYFPFDPSLPFDRRLLQRDLVRRTAPCLRELPARVRNSLSRRNHVHLRHCSPLRSTHQLYSDNDKEIPFNFILDLLFQPPVLVGAVLGDFGDVPGGGVQSVQ